MNYFPETETKSSDEESLKILRASHRKGFSNLRSAPKAGKVFYKIFVNSFLFASNSFFWLLLGGEITEPTILSTFFWRTFQHRLRIMRSNYLQVFDISWSKNLHIIHRKITSGECLFNKNAGLQLHGLCFKKFPISKSENISWNVVVLRSDAAKGWT